MQRLGKKRCSILKCISHVQYFKGSIYLSVPVHLHMSPLFNFSNWKLNVNVKLKQNTELQVKFMFSFLNVSETKIDDINIHFQH